jgi:thiol-disulfide isomerase/thioredoxin
LSEVEWVEDKDDLLVILASHQDVVVDFTAPSWCIPCQRFAPHYETAAGKSDAKFVAVDVDKAPWAMLDYGVQGVPTVMLFRDGKFAKNLQERTVIKLLTEIQS